MKKILLLNVVFTAFTAFTGAGTPVIPTSVVNEFRKQFGAEVNVRWEKIEEAEMNQRLFVAHFVQNGIWSEAYFEESGEFAGIGKNITRDQLPVKLLGLQQRKFKGYDIMEAYEYYLKDAEKPVYGLTITDKQNLIFLKINESGHFSLVKKEKFKN